MQLNASGTAAITAADIDAGSADNCAVASLALDVTNFTCDNIGDNAIALTVTDASGNSDICTATVTITDPDDICMPMEGEIEDEGETEGEGEEGEGEGEDERQQIPPILSCLGYVAAAGCAGAIIVDQVTDGGSGLDYNLGGSSNSTGFGGVFSKTMHQMLGDLLLYLLSGVILVGMSIHKRF